MELAQTTFATRFTTLCPQKTIHETPKSQQKRHFTTLEPSTKKIREFEPRKFPPQATNERGPATKISAAFSVFLICPGPHHLPRKWY
jgi:hypothetical protein